MSLCSPRSLIINYTSSLALKKTKQSAKTRTLILIILAISGNVHSNPGPAIQNIGLPKKPNKQWKWSKHATLPNWIYELSKCSRQLLLTCKNLHYCLTKISIRAKRSISRVFSLFIVPSPFLVHCPYKGRINRAESVLTGLKPY